MIMSIKGYKIRKKEEACVCVECSKLLGINDALKSEADSNSSEVTNLDTKQYASNFCVSCGKDITRGNGGEIRYPEAIATFLDKAFEQKGSRFGGVNPIIDSEYEKKEITDGVSFNEPVRTGYDPVIVDLYPDEEDLYNQICSFLNKIQTKGAIRYKSNVIEDDDGNISRYVVEVFAVQK
jgi:hypothetical protein